MIDIRELRIGNYVQYHDTYMRMDSLMDCDEWKIRLAPTRLKTVSINEVTPIVLTEKLLLKCAFKEYDDNSPILRYGCRNEHFKICIDIIELKRFIAHIHNLESGEHVCGVGIQYLHQLQNIFFDIIGDELEIPCGIPLK